MQTILIPQEYLVQDYSLTIYMLIVMSVLYLMVFALMGVERMRLAAAVAFFTLAVNWWLVESTLISGY